LFSLKVYAAAVLALGTAFWLGLPYPYWAMMSVYILAQSQSGRIRLKGMHMIGGTAIGGALGVVVAGLFSTSPTWLVIALGAAMMAGTYVAMRDRRSHFYFFLLGGITCLLVALPGMATPDTALLRAVARTEDVVVAVLSIAIIDKLICPRNETAAASTMSQGWLDSLREVTVKVLSGHAIDSKLQAEAAGKAIVLTPASDGLTCEGSGYGWERAHALRSAVTRGIRLMPLLSAIGDFDRVGGAAVQHPVDIETRALLAQWIDAGCPNDDRSSALRARLRADAVTNSSGHARAARLCYRRYLRGIYAGWRRIHRDHAQIAHFAHHAHGAPKRVRVPPGARMTPSTFGHVDRAYALRGALTIGVQMVIFSVLWHATGWSSIMALGMLLSAIFASIAGLTPAPLAVLKKIATTLAITSSVAAFYMVAVLPAVSSFPTLVLALLPAFFLIGYQVLKPLGLLFAILSIALMQLGDNGPGIAIDTLICSTIAIYLGIACAAIAHILVPKPAPAASVERLLRSTVRGLADVARARGAHVRQYAHDTLDRFLLIQTKLSFIESLAPKQPGLQTLRALRVALSLGTLRRWAGARTQRRDMIAPVLHLLQDRLAHWTLCADSPITPQLADALDDALNRAMLQTGGTAALRALTELRVALATLNRTAAPDLMNRVDEREAQPCQ
jgi:uncharacterized membrane protein YccC